MSTYKITFKDLRQKPVISAVLTSLEKGFARYGVDFYLVGAVARDVWMSAINGIPPSRITGDIDFAVFINDLGTYESLREYLIEKEGFIPVRDNAFVLLAHGVEVDLLPFGAIEDNSKVTMEGSVLTTINMPAFKEIYDDGLPQAELEDKHIFKFCTLPGIVILKLIAYDDRPENRRDDIKDISKILSHFFDMYEDEIYDNNNDIFDEYGDKDFKLILGSRVMGREMSKIAQRNATIYQRIEKMLADNLQEDAKGPIPGIMMEFFGNTLQDNILLLSEMQKGFLEHMAGSANQ